jgi:hypothetical protein
MFTLAERDHIREWLAFAAIYRYADPQLDQAITSVQSRADGGSQDDSSTEVRIRGYLTSLAAIDVQIDAALDCVGNIRVDKIELDPARGILMMERRQRVYAGRISDALSSEPYRDATSSAEIQPGGHYLVLGRDGWPS